MPPRFFSMGEDEHHDLEWWVKLSNREGPLCPRRKERVEDISIPFASLRDLGPEGENDLSPLPPGEVASKAEGRRSG